MSYAKLFTISLLGTVVAVLVLYFIDRPRPGDEPKLTEIGEDVFVTSQLSPRQLRALDAEGVQTIVDLRPDGEDAQQTPSATMQKAAQQRGIKFHYIPVPHEGIPDSAVTALSAALGDQSTSTVLYCRTGRRAVKTFALVEASRADGPTLTAIMDMVQKAGFTADDIKDNIAQRIAQRTSPPVSQTNIPSPEP
jgi:uncharacterized protein (TIGR01244 family)